MLTHCMFINIFISKGEQKGEAYDMNSDFSRTDSKHDKGPVNCYIFTQIYPIYLLSSGLYIVADSIHSLIH